METSGNRTALGVNTDTAQLVGARLRKARESIGRSTAALSTKIKVREHYLVAIEEGQWNELPPGLNGRGLIRIYARELAVSVPELDQAANQTVMPAEHDAQAPYQITGSKRDVLSEREPVNLRPNHDIVTPSAALPRVSDINPRTGALASSSRVGRTTDTKQSPRSSASSANTFRAMEMTPEEEPLDVVTPDVASILGISLDMGDVQPPPQKVKSISVAAPTPQSVEDVNPAQQYAEPLRTDAPPESFVAESQPIEQQHFNNQARKNKKHARGRHDRDSSRVHQPEAPMSAPTASDEPSRVQPAVAESPSEMQMAVKSVEPQALPVKRETAPETPAADSSVGVSAAETYLRSHSQVAVTAESAEKEVQTSSSRGFKVAVGLLAACVLVLVGGRLLTQESPATTDSEETKTVSQETSASGDSEGMSTSESAPSTPSDASAVIGEMPPQETQAALNQDGAAESETNSQTAQTPAATASTSAAPTTSPAAEASAQTAGSQISAGVSSASPVVAEKTATSTNAEPVVSSVNKVNAAGAATAVLTLTEPIEIQVTADGQRIYSGRHEAGKIDIKFNKRAEIFVQDGSKANLKYSGWEHGALGQAGRKRRIVLNADTFSSGRP